MPCLSPVKVTYSGLETFSAQQISNYLGITPKLTWIQFDSAKAASKLAGNFYAIVFSPMDLNLVNDGPNVRRKFLDTAIGQIYPLYNEKIRNYMKALNQRNTILRDVKFHSDIEFLLDDFEKSLSVLIKEIVKYRY